MKSSSFVRSQPRRSGEQSTAHIETCVYCSLCVNVQACVFVMPTVPIPPMLIGPTMSMSGSFHAPGRAYGQSGTCALTIRDICRKLSRKSPPVRQHCPPTFSPHVDTFARPYWQSENTMSRFCAASASPIRRNGSVAASKDEPPATPLWLYIPLRNPFLLYVQRSYLR